MNNLNPVLVTFGRGGHTVYFPSEFYEGGSSKSTLHGYQRPEAPPEAPDGTPALNILPAVDTGAGFSWAIRGPLLDPDLADGDVDPCPVPDPVLGAALDVGFGGMVSLQSAHRQASAAPGPLDGVSVPAFIAGWLAVGAVSGVYRAGSIAWDKGDES